MESDLICNQFEEKSFILELIKKYQTLPALWNVSCKEYSSKAIRDQQFDVLLVKFREKYPNADRKALKRKINSLRSNYKRELKRIKNLDINGAEKNEFTESNLYYFQAMDFINNTEHPYSSRSNTELAEVSIPKRKKKPEDATDRLIALATTKLQSSENNEYKEIAEVWAKKLIKMNENQRLIAERIINEVMFFGQLDLLNFDTSLTNINRNATSLAQSACQLNL